MAFVDAQLCSAAVTASSLNGGRLSAVCTPMGSVEGGGDLRKGKVREPGCAVSSRNDAHRSADPMQGCHG